MQVFSSRRFRTVRRFWALIFVLTALQGNAFGQGVIQSPSEFLGYPLGERFTRHHRVVEYFQYVSSISPRVRLQTYGETNEGRTLLLAFVTSPDNQAELETIRLNNLRRAGLAEGAPAGVSAPIVWLSYNVHGNESVSTEAAMATLFDLADPGNEKTQRWLSNTVVVIDPDINPDGRDRYVNGYNRATGMTMNVNPDAAEHSEAWPGGRTNHYYFDLNRDWAWQTQVETRQRLVVYNQWMPEIHVDFHEQGVNSPYYFAPAAEPLHKAITDFQRRFQVEIGKNHARYFDENGWLYFTRQVFDLFYPGYGDTYPMYNGAIGMTYEQGGGGRAGLGIITAEKDTLRLTDRLAHHHTTGLSTIETASNNHDLLLGEFSKFFERAKTNPAGVYRSYVLKESGDNGRLQAVRAHLDRLGISYGTVTGEQKATGFAYRSGRTMKFSALPGDLVITAFQPKSTMLQVLMEPQSELVDSLTYDITAWSLPYLYDVEAFATKESIRPEVVFPEPSGHVAEGPEKPYAWLIRWNDVSDIGFLSELLKQKIRVRFTTRAFKIEGAQYDSGTLIITRTGNETKAGKLPDLLEKLADSYHETITPVGTGLVDSGPDFGSSDVRYVKAPRVAVLTGSPLSSGSVGEIWNFFDQQINYPVTMIKTDALGRIDLDSYDVLVLPSGSYGSILTEERLKSIQDWIKRGGRMIAVQGAATHLAGNKGFSIKKKETGDKEEKKDKETTVKKPPAQDVLRAYGSRARDGVSRRISGAIYRVAVDTTHPLAFGLAQSSFTLRLRTGAPAYLEGKESWNVGVVKIESLVSGRVGYKAAPKQDETLAYGVQSSGSGSIVYFVDDPLFRGFWYTGQMVFGNAVFLVGQR